MTSATPRAKFTLVRTEHQTRNVVLSIVFIVATLVFLVVGSLVDFIALVFTDNCPPATCNVDHAVSSVVAAILVAAVIALLGIVFTIIWLVRRIQAWPFALVSAVLVVIALVLGALLYSASVGML